MDVAAQAELGCAYLTIDGPGAGQELELLAGWLSRDDISSGRWRVSIGRSGPPAEPRGMGAGDMNTILAVLQTVSGAAQLLYAAHEWRAARASQGRSDTTVIVIINGQVTEYGPDTEPDADGH